MISTCWWWLLRRLTLVRVLLVASQAYNIKTILLSTSKMPRRSERHQVLKEYEKWRCQQQQEDLLHLAMEDDVSVIPGEREEDDISTGSDLLRELVSLQTRLQFENRLAQRYVEPRRLYRSSAGHSVFERDLMEGDGSDGIPSWLTRDEFLQKYRLHRENFDYVVNRLSQHEVFRSGKVRRPQRPPSHQLMLFLHYLGTSGSGASNPRLRNMFGIGRGTAESYKRRCITAIRSLKDEYITWPDDQEKRRIAKRIFKSSNGCWLNCIGVADGMHTNSPHVRSTVSRCPRLPWSQASIFFVSNDCQWWQ